MLTTNLSMMTCFKHKLLIIASHFQKQTYQFVIADQLLNREGSDSYQDSESKQERLVINCSIIVYVNIFVVVLERS